MHVNQLHRRMWRAIIHFTDNQHKARHRKYKREVERGNVSSTLKLIREHFLETGKLENVELQHGTPAFVRLLQLNNAENCFLFPFAFWHKTGL